MQPLLKPRSLCLVAPEPLLQAKPRSLLAGRFFSLTRLKTVHRRGKVACPETSIYSAKSGGRILEKSFQKPSEEVTSGAAMWQSKELSQCCAALDVTALSGPDL